MTSFQYRAFRAAMILFASAASLSALTAPAGAAISYYDAESGASGNTVNANTSSPANQTDWIGSIGDTDHDNLWRTRSDGSLAAIEQGGDIWESQGPPSEDAPEIITTITGLNPSLNYRVYLVYGANPDGNWGIRAALGSDALSIYDNNTGSVTSSAGGLDERQALLGVVFGGVTSISVHVDDLAAGPGNDSRSWYDGVALDSFVPEPASLSVLVGLVPFALRRRRIVAR